MATPTLTAYRQLNPHLAGKDDAELLEDLANQLHAEGTLQQYPDVVEALSARDREYRQSHKPGLAKEFVRSFVGGVDTGQGMLYSAIGQAGDATGIDAIKNFGLQGYQRNQVEAAENQPTIGSVDDVHGVSDALSYAAGVAGSQAPQIGATLAASAAGGLIGGPPGAVAGGIGAGYVQSQNYADLELGGGEDAASTAAMVGIVSGLLEAVVPLKVLRSTFGAAPSGIARMGMEALLQRAEQKVPGIVGAMQGEIVRNGSAEALTEVAQELTSMAGELYSNRNNPAFDISNKELTDRLLNSAAAGAILGGITGAPEGIAKRKTELGVQQQVAARLAQINGPIDERYDLRPEETFVRPPQTPFSLDETYNQPVETPMATPPVAPPHPDVAAARAWSQPTPTVPPLNEQYAQPTEAVPTLPPQQSFDEQYVQPHEAVSTLEPTQAFDERYTQPKEEIPPAGFSYAYQPPFDINGETHPGFTQVDTYDYNGNNVESSNPAALRARGYDIPDVPEGLPSGNYTVDQIKKALKPEAVELPSKMEFGDASMGGLLKHRDVIPQALPTLRKEPTVVKADATIAEIEALAGEGVRKNEQTKSSTKRLVAIRDNDTGNVTLYPVYESSGHRMRLDNGIEAKVDSKAALARTLGLDNKQARSQDDALRDVLREVTEGSKEDDFLSEFLSTRAKTGPQGTKKYTVLAFVDAEGAADRRHFFFEDEAKFRDASGYVAEQKITSKGSKGGSEGVPQLLAKLTELSPLDAQAVQLLAGILESMPDAKRMNGTLRPGSNARADSSKIINKLLKAPRQEVFAETLAQITNPDDLLSRGNDGRYFKLFTKNGWSIFKTLIANKGANQNDLLTIVDSAIQEAGYESQGEYLRKVIPFSGEKSLGAELKVESGATEAQQEDDNLSAQAVEEGTQRDISEKAADVGGAPEAAYETGETVNPTIPEGSLGVVGLSDKEAHGLAIAFTNMGTKDKPKYSTEQARNIVEARADSEISNPTEDLEFQAVKEDLNSLVRALFTETRREMPNLSDEFLYGIYANLDKISRDSQALPSSFRETNDTIQRIFNATTAWLGDKGVDVRLVQKHLNSQIEFLQKEWGRSIVHEDGRRIIVVGMQDVTTPSRDNLRILFHEVAHQMFADQPVWVQRLLHDAVTRLSDVQLNVFSKTYDQRLKNRTLDHTVLMEEVLAEHLAFSGVAQEAARGWAQRLIDGIKKAYAHAVMVYSALRGINVSPELTLKYMELRFKDMLDKTVGSATDFDVLTGNMRNVARYRATLYNPVGYVVERFNAAEGQFVINDVTDESKLASELNLENKLTFSDVVVRDNRSDIAANEWKHVGVSDKPAPLGDVLENIATSSQFDSQIRYTARIIKDQSALSHDSKVSFGTAKDDDLLKTHPAYYDLATHDVRINLGLTVGFTMNERALLVLHEAMHAATSGAVSAYTIYKTARGNRNDKIDTVVAAIASRTTPKKAQALAKQVASAMRPLKQLDDLFQHLKKIRFAAGEYGMTNLDEFAAEAISNRAFQRKLASVQVPAHLKIAGTKDSAFSTIIKLIEWLFTSSKPRNALESALNGIEQVMMVAEPISHRQEGGIAFAPPISEEESDRAVQKDFESEFAALNSQADLYHSLFDAAAARVNMDFDTYLRTVIGVYNPEKSIEQLMLKMGSRSRPIPVNENLRINDSKGRENQVVSPVDRKKVVDRMLETASRARKKISDKAIELADKLPRYEKEFERTQNRLIRFETMLHDVTTIRDNALKILRKGLRGAERNAQRLIRWSTRHDGLAGVAAELFGVKDEESIPEDYADLVVDSVDEHEDDFFITDTLTAAQEAGVDFDLLTPTQIEAAIQAAARTTRDPRLMDVADGSPQAKADLSLLIYYAKTAPEDMVALAVRVEKDLERKEEILATIKKIIQGNYESATGLNDLFKEVRKGDVRVGKAKSSLSNAIRQLSQAKKQVEMAKLRVKELEFAAKALDGGIKASQKEIGIRAARFEPHDGAKILLTGGSEVKEGVLKLGPKSNVATTKILMENIAWLNANAASEGELLWQTIKDQSEGLKRVVGEHVERDFRESFWTRHFGSIPERLYSIGTPVLKIAADRFSRYFGYRQSIEPIVTKGREVTLKYREAQKATGFENSYSGFKDTFWNPANHFIQHLSLLPSSDMQENQNYVKEQTKLLFMRSAITRDIVMKPGAFEAIWDALLTNARVSKQVANQASAWKVFVEDSDIYIKNPRTGVVEKAQRPALDVGLFTTQASINKVFAVKELLDSITTTEGLKLWAEWANDPSKRGDLKQLFNDDVIFHFVRPYIYDTSTLHFAAPALIDGKTRNRANPLSVQAAWESANGDITAFAAKLFDLEDTVGTQENAKAPDERKKQFVDETIGFFRGQYKKIYGLSERQERFNGKGMTADRFLASPMMDSITARDFPPEFIDYAVYDHTTLQNLLSQLAAHAAFGRDLGMFSGPKDANGGIMWELGQAEADLRREQAEYTRLAEEVKRNAPNASVKEVDKEILKRVGEEKFNRLKNVGKARGEVRQIEQEIVSYFTSPNGSTRDMQMAQTVVGTLAGAMVNNFKSVLNSLYIAFEPFMVYGIGKTGAVQVERMLGSIARSGAGSFIQAFGGQAVLASKYARYMNEHGIGRDPANETTAAQIISDTGKNNVYEDARMLGWLRKGRSLAFDAGFRGAEGERIAPKLRVFAPFSMMSIAQNQGAMESQIQLIDDVLKAGIAAMDATPGSLNDPSFEFTAKDINGKDNMFDDLAYEELKDQFRRMGTSIEIEVRNLVNARNAGHTLGDIVVSPDLARLAAAEGMRVISLPSDVSTAPVWLSNNPLGRISMPLITWSLNKTNQIVGAFREPNGEVSRRVVMAAIASLALGMVPAAILISLLTDQYDERVLGKKSNLAGFNFDSPAQTGVALMERVGRIGTFGLAGDLVNGVRVYGTSGDLRGVSIDQRVVFVNTLMSMMALTSTAWNQEGTLTYDTFYRPLVNTLGGGGILQNQQILNNITNSLMGAPVFTAEAETTARINALNYLRGAGRVVGLDVRSGAGMRSIPTPIKPWVNQMVVAAYGNNPSEFVDAYQKAVSAATEEGKENPDDYVKRSFQTYHPLRYTFRTSPSKTEVSQLMGALSDKGREDVSQALQYFNAYSSSLGLKPYDGRELTVKKEAKANPSPWGTTSKTDPWK